MNKLQEAIFVLALNTFVKTIKDKGEKKSFFYRNKIFLVNMHKDFMMIDNLAVGVLIIKDIAFTTRDSTSEFGEVLGLIDCINPWYATICQGVENQQTKLFLSLVGYNQMEDERDYIKLIPPKKNELVNSSDKNHPYNAT